MKHILLTLLLILTLCATALGADIFVAPTATGSEDGSTVTDAMTVAVLNTSTLSTNDVVIFKSEVTYTTGITLNSCTAANITLRASESTDGDWGDGTKDKDTSLPTFDGDTISGRPIQISNDSLVNLTIEYLKISGTQGQTGWGSMMYFGGSYTNGTITITGCVFDGESSANYVYPTHGIETGNQECYTTSFVIQDCEFKDFIKTDEETSCTAWTYPTIAEDQSIGHQGNMPITLYWQAGTANTGTILITGNKFTNIVGDHIHILAYQGSSCEISNNWFETWYENAIDLKGVTNCKIKNNYFKEGLPDDVDKAITMATMGAIVTHTGTHGGTWYGDEIEISGNYFTNIKGSGMSLSGYTGDGPTVKHNYFKDVTRPLYLNFIAEDIKFFGNVVNITSAAQVYDGLNCCATYTYAGCANWTSDYSYTPMYWYNLVQRVQFYNNTIYVNNADFYYAMFFHGSLDGSIPSHIKNNIFVVTENHADNYPIRTYNPTLDIDDANFTHNILANLGGAQNAIEYKGTLYAETEQADFLTDHPDCTGTLFADPGMTDPANGDFSLTSGANAIDAGTDLGATYLEGINWDECDWTADPRSNTLVATLSHRDYGSDEDSSTWALGATVYQTEGQSPPTMEAHWEFEDDPGILVASVGDMTPLTDHGTVTNDTGQVGEAIILNGTDQYLSHAGAAGDFSWNTTNECTVCAWIYVDTSTATMAWLGKGSTGGSDYDISAGILADGSPWIGVGYNSGEDSEFVYFTGANLEDEKWYHVCLGFNDTGVTTAGLADQEARIRIWDDTAGALLNSAEETPTFSNHWEPGQGGDLNIGAVGGAGFWDGKVDQVKVYNYAMTSDQMDNVRGESQTYEFTESSAPATTYSTVGDTVTITVTTSTEAFVEGGIPYATLETGVVDAIAYYTGKTATTQTYVATLTAGMRTTDLAWKDASITLPTNCTMEDMSENDFTLTLPDSGAITNTTVIAIAGTFEIGTDGDVPLWSDGSTGFHDLSYDIDSDTFWIMPGGFTDDVEISASNCVMRGYGRCSHVTGGLTLSGDDNYVGCVLFSTGASLTGTGNTYHPICSRRKLNLGMNP